MKYLILKIIFLFTGTALFAQGVTNNGANLLIQSGASINISGGANAHYKNLTSGGNHGELDIDGVLYLEGDWINNASSGKGLINTTGPVWGTVILSGTNPQSIGGTRTTEFERLEVRSSLKTLNVNNVQVNSLVKLVASDIKLNHNTLILNTTNPAAISASVGSGIISEDSTANFGIIEWRINSSTGSNYVFPFKTVDGISIPFTYTPNSGVSGNVSVATYHTPPENNPMPPTVNHLQDAVTGADNSNIVVDRFWYIDVTGTPNADLTFYGTNAEASATVNPRAQRWIAANDHWESPQGVQTNPTSYSAQAQGITNFNNWWVLAPLANPLPVELLSFKGECLNKAVDLYWATATETNNDYFTIERSIDRINFETIGFVQGAGNSNNVLTYTFRDEHPANTNMYYRLIQTDFDGESEIFDPIEIKPCVAKSHWSLVSASAQNGAMRVIFQSNQNESLYLDIYDMLGNRVLQQELILYAGYQSEEILIPNLTTGVYLITCKSESNTQSLKLISQ